MELEVKGRGKVKPEVEILVRELARRLGFLPYTVRNTAILYGLAQIALSRRIPETDEEFLELLELVRRVVDGVKG